MNTEHELFGELHEQEENGLFGNEHRRQYEAQQEALRLSAAVRELKCQHDWRTFFNKGYRKCNKCGEEYTIKAF
jgi:hypothetical protein